MKKKTAKQIIYFIVSLAALIALCSYIFSLSAETAEVSSETSEGVIAFIEKLFGYAFSQDTIRTAAHFCEYALLGFLVINAFFSYSYKIRYILSPLLAWGYAWTDEIHQLFVEGRAFQFTDLAVDLGGIILGCIAFAVLVAIIRKIISKKEKKAG